MNIDGMKRRLEKVEAGQDKPIRAVQLTVRDGAVIDADITQHENADIVLVRRIVSPQ